MDAIRVTEEGNSSPDRIINAIGALKKEITEIQSGISERRSELSELSRKLEDISTIPVIAKKYSSDEARNGLADQDFALCAGMNEAKFAECVNYYCPISEDVENEVPPPNCFSFWEDESSAGSLCAFELIERLLDNAVYGDVQFQLNRKDGGIHVPSEISHTAMIPDNRVLLPNRSVPGFVSKPKVVETEVQSNRSLPELRADVDSMDRGDLKDPQSLDSPAQRQIRDYGEACAETPAISKSSEEIPNMEATKPILCAEVGDVQLDSEELQ